MEVHNLVRKFGDLVAVNDISFEVEHGEIFAFLGPNGAGKSTTIKMLTTLLTPTSGKILVNGHDPVTQQDEVRKSFGIVFQDPSLDDELTAYENMDFHAILYSVPRRSRRQQVEELLRFVQLWERRDSLVKTFSGGMKRRLEIARGLLHHPTILFLDEPTLGLDPQTRNLIWEHIHDMNKQEGVTVFFTTHYMEEAARIAERVAIIDHGRIMAIASPDELKEQTNTQSLEDAFLAITGRAIREEEGTALDRMRMRSRAWRGQRR
ncbi:MAG TPA: ATP-binding cassette domain-containing protein [Armatimonadota bacterium]|nr:ATP-binding cassette domain-containing protein [Armatimonadota bacterium]